MSSGASSKTFHRKLLRTQIPLIILMTLRIGPEQFKPQIAQIECGTQEIRPKQKLGELLMIGYKTTPCLTIHFYKLLGIRTIRLNHILKLPKAIVLSKCNLTSRTIKKGLELLLPNTSVLNQTFFTNIRIL